jgi:hypothetical protein
MRFGQHQGAGGAGCGELVEGLGDHYQPGFRTRLTARRSQHPRVEQQVAAALAGMKFGKDVEAVHSEDA